MAVKSREREVISARSRIPRGPRSASCIALTVACGLVVLPESAGAQQHDVLRTFPLGQDDASLGFRAGDTVAYDETAILASVDPNGVAYIVDRVNTRVVISKPTEVVVLSRPWLMTPIGVVGLSDGSFVVGSSGSFRRLDPAGNVLGMILQTGLLERALPNGRFIVRRLRESETKFLEYNSSLEIAGQHVSEAGFSPTSVSVGGAATVRFEGRCWIVPRKLRAGGTRAHRSGDRLRYMGISWFVEAVVGGETAAWEFPADEIGEGDIPPVVAALEDGNITIIRRYTSTVLGQDGQFYSLAQTPERYELIRWDLTKLPKETFPPISNTPPTIVFDGPTTATAGSKILVWVKGSDTEPEMFKFTASNLPDGARLHTGAAEDLAAFVWTPSEEQVGEHAINITVEDSMCGQTTQTLTITVEPSQ